MPRMTTTVNNDCAFVSNARRESFNKETKPRLNHVVNLLIKKIGIVNTIALIGALSDMDVTNERIFGGDKTYQDNYFTLVPDKDKSLRHCVSDCETLVDNNYRWRSRFCRVYGHIVFGKQ